MDLNNIRQKFARLLDEHALYEERLLDDLMAVVGQEMSIIPLPGSDDWSEISNYAEHLDKVFPGQDAWNFAYACSYNDWGPVGEDNQIKELLMLQEGQNDEREWIWQVTFDNKEIWRMHARCDFTGWDCQSGNDWTLFGVANA